MELLCWLFLVLHYDVGGATQIRLLTGVGEHNLLVVWSMCTREGGSVHNQHAELHTRAAGPCREC